MTALTLARANQIISVALAAARERGHRPMAVVVLDEGGHLRSAQREDGASMFRIEIATGKAWAAVAMGASSRALLERGRANPLFYGSLPATAHGKFLAQTGAVLIKSGAEIVGAVGASGGSGDEDEAICMLGVAAAGFQHV